MRRRACSFVIFALALVGLDLVVALVCRTALADRTVDVQQPPTLLARLDRLRSAPSPKIVLLGDSLVYGEILAEFGDTDWRAHGLGEQLADALEERHGRRPFVMNLGMNGALPADLEALVPLVVACDVDWVVFDIHLRPFSTDFSPPDRQMSRPWVREMSVGPDGRARWRPYDPTAWLSGRAADHSAIWRNRGLVQEHVLSTQIGRRPALHPPAPVTETDAEIQSLVKLAQLKNRLKSLDLGPGGPQATALQRTLGGLAARGQRHVVFYAKEDPDLLAAVMACDEHAAHFERVAGLVRRAQGPTGVFVPPLPELQPEHFLDFTHLNADGYRLLARRLAVEFK